MVIVAVVNWKLSSPSKDFRDVGFGGWLSTERGFADGLCLNIKSKGDSVFEVITCTGMGWRVGKGLDLAKKMQRGR